MSLSLHCFSMTVCQRAVFFPTCCLPMCVCKTRRARDGPSIRATPSFSVGLGGVRDVRLSACLSVCLYLLDSSISLCSHCVWCCVPRQGWFLCTPCQ